MAEHYEVHRCPDCGYESPYAPSVPEADRICLRCSGEVPPDDDPDLQRR